MRAARFTSVYFLFFGVYMLVSSLYRGSVDVYGVATFLAGIGMGAIGAYRIVGPDSAEEYPAEWGPLTYALVLLVVGFVLLGLWTLATGA